MMYDSWDIEHDRQICLSFWTIFCPFTSLTTQNIKILKKKLKNAWRCYYFTHVCHKLQSYDVWLLKYQPQQTEIFVIFDNFLPIYPIKTWKIKILKKWKQCVEISSFYTSVPKIMIICYTVPEIWHMTDVIIIFHFGLFFALLPPNSPKNQNFEKMKKTPGDIIILHMCTKNYDQMMYGSWDMVCDRCNCYFSFWAIFCTFTPLTARKVKILKKWEKTPWDIIILHMCTKNYD